jgi:hypothetical protein
MKKDYIIECLASAVVTLFIMFILWLLCIGFSKVFDIEAAKCWFLFSSLIIGIIVYNYILKSDD